MKVAAVHDHNHGKEKFDTEPGLRDELFDLFTRQEIDFETMDPRDIKRVVAKGFNQKGWADSVCVGKSNLTISFLKCGVGLCFQLGNVARTYADLLKLQFLFQQGSISLGVVVVPVMHASRQLGSNHASYDRLVTEIEMFRDIISAPIVVIGIES